MKKILAMLCAAVWLGFAFTACSNDSSDSEYWYNIDMGGLSKTSFDSLGINQAEANTSNDTNFYIYQKLRSSSYGSMSVKEGQLYETFSLTGMPESMINSEIEKLKSLRNCIMIVEDGSIMKWYYAESAGNCTEPIQ